jgi:hypothetical protein
LTLPIKAELLVDLGNWQRGLTKANKQMAGFGKSMKTISNGVKAAWAGIAVGVVGNLYDGLVDLTKAAADDAKSQALLNAQMKKTWGGNQKLNASIDAQIDAMSNATGILDDNLRPALIRIAAVTKSPAKGMKMLALSADIAAKQGLDLNAVSKAMAKYLGGNKTALDRMVPGLSTAGDRMAFLTKNYSGFAEIAGSNDPFSRINVVMENFKEKLGKSFLPVVQKFADWLASGESQKAMDDLAAKVNEFGEWFASPEGQETFKQWMADLKEMIKLAGDFLGLAGDVAKLLTPKKKRVINVPGPTGLVGDGTNPNRDTLPYTPKELQARLTGDNRPSWDINRPDTKRYLAPNPPKIEITINSSAVDGKGVLRELYAVAQKRGIPLAQLLK